MHGEKQHSSKKQTSKHTTATKKPRAKSREKEKPQREILKYFELHLETGNTTPEIAGYQ